jgi:transposase-like protein
MSPIETSLREKMQLVMRVETVQVKAADAARQMGVSRKTFYQWRNRALSAMAAALTPRLAGRRAKSTDPQTEHLLGQNAELQRENLQLQQTLRVRELLHEGCGGPQPGMSDGTRTEKKAGKGRRGLGRRLGHARGARRDVPAPQ